MSLDSTIQKYLTGHAEANEKEWLLSELCKFYNELLIFIQERQKERLLNEKERAAETRWDG